MTFKVVSIIDGDTFDVTPKWIWDGKEGNRVRAAGYNAPEQGQLGYEAANRRLRNLIDGKEVDLKNPIKITYGRLLCEVYLNGKNLADYFPEYK